MNYVNDLLSQDYVKQTSYFHEKKVSRLLTKYQKSNVSSEIQDMAFLGILSTQLVHQQFIENFTFDIKPVQPDKIIRN